MSSSTLNCSAAQLGMKALSATLSLAAVSCSKFLGHCLQSQGDSVSSASILGAHIKLKLKERASELSAEHGETLTLQFSLAS